MKTTLTGAGLLAGALLLGSGAAQATLVNYTAVGANLVYDQDRNLTWVADANLFKTQYDADNTTVGKIIAAVPTVAGHAIVTGDFTASNGQMNWWGAMAWAEWLGSIGYGGASDWRLWSALNADGSGPCSGHNCTGSDLGHLFYTEGGLTLGNSILDSTILDDHFVNMQSYRYWSGGELPNPTGAWDFRTSFGLQFIDGVYNQYYGWAVRPGQVVAAPLPATGWLIALGLMALGAGRRGRRATLVIR